MKRSKRARAAAAVIATAAATMAPAQAGRETTTQIGEVRGIGSYIAMSVREAGGRRTAYLYASDRGGIMRTLHPLSREQLRALIALLQETEAALDPQAPTDAASGLPR